MNSKAMQRIGTISSNALRQVLVSLYNIAFPFLALHFATKEIWGGFVNLLLFSLLVLQIVSWGSKEYQIRQFSQTPGAIAKNYSEVLATRWIWVLVFSAAAFIWFPIWQSVFLILWIVGRYLAQSTESLVIYEKAFNAAIAVETISFGLFCLAFLFFKSEIDLQLLLILYSFYQFTKGVSYVIYFRKFLSMPDLKRQRGFYRDALPFFLLSVMGFLASKVDVYLIALMKNKIATADYQVINSLLVFVMSLSAFVYAPFTKNIYRNSQAVVVKTQKALVLSGMVIVPASLVVIAVIVKNYLGLDFAFGFYLIAFAYVFPAFAYGIDVVNLFRQRKEKKVVAFLFAGALSNTFLSAALIYFGFGIPGALTGSAIAQMIVLTLFKFDRREK